MDSGCNCHMNPNKDLFEELCDQDGIFVLLGNNKSCKIVSVGSVRFKFHDESIKLLTEVRYVPDLKRNLISLGEFDKNQRSSFLSQTGIQSSIDSVSPATVIHPQRSLSVEFSVEHLSTHRVISS